MPDNEDLRGRINRNFESHLFYTMLFSAGYGMMRRRFIDTVAACRGELGVVKNFKGKKVCELADLQQIHKIVQLEDGDTRILATMESGEKIYTEPRTLNRFRQAFSVKKNCYGNICEFEKTDFRI